MQTEIEYEPYEPYMEYPTIGVLPKEPSARQRFLVYDTSADASFDGNPRLLDSIPQWVMAGNRHGLNVIVDLTQNERCFRGKWNPIPFVPIPESQAE